MLRSRQPQLGAGKKIFTLKYIIYWHSGCVYNKESKYIKTLTERQLNFVKELPVKGIANKFYIERCIDSDFEKILPTEIDEQLIDSQFDKELIPLNKLFNKNRTPEKIEDFKFTRNECKPTLGGTYKVIRITTEPEFDI